MILIDASALIPLFITERRSEQMVDVLDAIAWQAIDVLARGEVVSAFARLVREGRLARDAFVLRLGEFAEWCEDADLIAFDDADFAVAENMVADPDTVLRMPDALHLAVALRCGVPLLTLDRGLGRAALMFGAALHPVPA